MSPAKTPMSPRPKRDPKTGLPLDIEDPNVVASRAGYFTKQYENSPVHSGHNSPGMSSRAMSPVAASIMSPRPQKKVFKKKKGAVDLAKAYRDETHKAFS
jgi:hypothetical protein